MLNVPKSFRWLLSVSAAILAVPVMSPVAMAQQGSDEAIEEIITTGTRRAERTVSESSVPIDVISGQELGNMGTADLDDMLRNTVPSYNVTRQSISDAATLVRPANLRGLPPDNTLVLVNGKRRHRAAVIAELGGSLAAGSQGADISAIPSLAIKQVEILRDGAAAQYGSDAIAGVLNFVLRDESSGFSAEARTGEFFEGDGTMFQFMANAGLPLGPDGFANVTFSFMEQDRTTRSTQQTAADVLIAAGNDDIATPYVQAWGGPEYRDNFNLFINTGIQLTANQEVYAFGNVGGRETEDAFFFRNPNSRPGVYTNGDIRAVVDTNIQRGDINVQSNCPALVSPGSGGSGQPLDPAAVAADAMAIAGLPDNCWVMNQVVPGGYTPQFGGKLEDASIVGGLRGELDNGLLYDFSASFGRNSVDFFLNNTWNPALGPDGIIQGELQRNFDIGAYIQSETNFNADFVYPISNDMFASDINLAFGAEYRDEVFEITIGEENSWAEGRFAFQSGGGTNTYADGVTVLSDLSVGAHGFAGFSPSQAGKFGRSNVAVYTEAEADIVENFTLAAALRFEDFEDFGTTTNGKLAARWAISDAFALRGSASTGFRAPTPGQANVTKVSTITVQGELQQQGQIPPTNPIATYLGGAPLGPEDAVNYTAGFVWDVSDTFNVTVDLFQIELDDRIAATGTIDIADEPLDAGLACPNTLALAAGNPNRNLAFCLQELGVPGAGTLSSVAFYTNDFETTTTGVDLVATYNTDFGNAGSGTLVAAWNWTDTKVDAVNQNSGGRNVVSRDRVLELENFNPESRGIFTYNHFLGDWRFLARASYYGEWVDAVGNPDPTPRGADGTGYRISCGSRPNPGASGGVLFDDHCYPDQWVFDFEVGYDFADNWSGVVGVQNLFDEMGPLDKSNLDNTVGSGNTYATGSPFGFEGGFWYVRLRADFE
ncbi:MAG: TonB-dependent receptor [Woeseia sp.]